MSIFDEIMSGITGVFGDVESASIKTSKGKFSSNKKDGLTLNIKPKSKKATAKVIKHERPLELGDDEFDVDDFSIEEDYDEDDE